MIDTDDVQIVKYIITEYNIDLVIKTSLRPKKTNRIGEAVCLKESV